MEIYVVLQLLSQTGGPPEHFERCACNFPQSSAHYHAFGFKIIPTFYVFIGTSMVCNH